MFQIPVQKLDVKIPLITNRTLLKSSLSMILEKRLRESIQIRVQKPDVKIPLMSSKTILDALYDVILEKDKKVSWCRNEIKKYKNEIENTPYILSRFSVSEYERIIQRWCEWILKWEDEIKFELTTKDKVLDNFVKQFHIHTQPLFMKCNIKFDLPEELTDIIYVYHNPWRELFSEIIRYNLFTI